MELNEIGCASEKRVIGDGGEGTEPQVYFTRLGEVRFFAAPTPRFVMHNPNLEKSEMIVFFDTIRKLHNYLPDAQAKGRAWLHAKTDADEKEEKVIYRKFFDLFGTEPVMQTHLEANVYKGKVHVWLRRYFKEETGSWKSCRGGFQFTLDDSVRDLHDFAMERMNEVRLAKKRKAEEDIFP